MPDFLLREARETDFKKIAELHRLIWPQDQPVEEYICFYNWLLKKNPASGYSLVGVNGKGEISAHCCLAGFYYSVNGRRRKGGFICQLMVRDDFRKSLLFASLESRLLNQYPARKMDFAYGLIDGSAILKAHLAMGFKQAGKVPVYARPYKIFRILRKAAAGSRWKTAFVYMGYPFLKIAEQLLRVSCTRKNNLELIEVERFDENFDRLFQQISRSFKISALRTSDICNWRFFGLKERGYNVIGLKDKGNILGYAVLRRMKMKTYDVLAVVDLFFLPGHRKAGKRLFYEIHRRSVQKKVDMAVCLLGPESYISRMLGRAGFIKSPGFFTSVINTPGGIKDFTGPKDWHMTWFDHDYV